MAKVEAECMPLYFLNHTLDNEILTRQLEGMRDKEIQEVIVGPRYGLPEGIYLSPEWFGHFGHIVNESKKLGIGIWIYDDMDWPSGTANGQLTRAADSPHKAHVLFENGGHCHVKEAGFKTPYHGYSYIDVLKPDTVREFIKGTYEKYKMYFGDEFGTTIKGFFSDEPGLYANMYGKIDPQTLPYTEDLFAEFAKRRGYNPQDELPFIWKEEGERSRKIRLDYFQTLSELYQENFLGQIRDWCHSNGLLFIGHLLEEENPLSLVKSQADPFAAASYFDSASYDLVGSLNKDHIIAANLARSVAKIYGKDGVMAEAMGGFGRKMPVEEMKRIAKWLAKNGTNRVVPHALFYSSDNVDVPPSFMQEPFWSKFSEFIQEFRRDVEEQEDKPRKLAIFYPVASLCAKYNPRDETNAAEISETLRIFSLMAAEKGVSFDYLNDKAILNGGMDYEQIALPRTEVLALETLQFLKTFVDQGGKLIFVGDYPKYATKSEAQEEFDKLMKDLKNQPENVSLLPLKIPLSSILRQRLTGFQYQIWEKSSKISPSLTWRVVETVNRLCKLSPLRRLYET